MHPLFVLLMLAPFAQPSGLAKQPAARAKADDCPGPMAVYGRVQIVDSFPDCKVKVVESFEDLRVRVVASFPYDVGEWQLVASFPDFTVQFVEAFPDFTIRYVDSFPGAD